MPVKTREVKVFLFVGRKIASFLFTFYRVFYLLA